MAKFSIFSNGDRTGSRPALDIRIILLFVTMAMLSMGSLYQIEKSAEVTARINNLRAPTAQYSLTMINGVNGASAALRGWLLNGDEESKNERARIWLEEIDAPLNDMIKISGRWTNPDNVARLDRIRMLLPQFEKQQLELEEIAQFRDRVPATIHLADESAPLGDELILLLQEMSQNQSDLLHEDVRQTEQLSQILKYLQWGMFALGVALVIFLGRYRSIEVTRQTEIEDEGAHLTAMSECSGLRETCDVALQRLAAQQNAVIGLVYYFNQSTRRLHLGGLYGTKPGKARGTIVVGDGVIGQCFVNKVISRVDYAASGATVEGGPLPLAPRQLLTFPLFYNDDVIGVAQFACLNNLTPYQENRMVRKLQTTARFIHEAIQGEETRRQIELLDKRVIVSSTDAKGRITHVSSAFADISGYTKEEMIGENHRLVRHPDGTEELYKGLWKTITAGKNWSGEIKNRRKDGSYYWVDAWISPNYDLFGNIVGYTGVRSEISDKKKVEELSITDELTQLYNRRHFDTLFQHQLDIARREGKRLAFAIMDIDYFKPYNDNYGHQQGDEALKEVSAALNDFGKRPTDYVFRLGGEEFGILFMAETLENAEGYCRGINAAVNELQIPHEHSQATPHVSISIGLVLTSANSAWGVDALYKEADGLLYQAKEAGRNRVVGREIESFA